MAAVLAETVAHAIVELGEDYKVDVAPTGDGGAIVTVRDIDIGARWSPQIADVEFLIAFNYPYAPIYPYYTREDLTRTDGSGWPTALQHVDWRGKRVVQISLRASRWNPDVDTARGAIAQVRQWFQEIS